MGLHAGPGFGSRDKPVAIRSPPHAPNGGRRNLEAAEPDGVGARRLQTFGAVRAAPVAQGNVPGRGCADYAAAALRASGRAARTAWG